MYVRQIRLDKKERVGLEQCTVSDWYDNPMTEFVTSDSYMELLEILRCIRMESCNKESSRYICFLAVS